MKALYSLVILLISSSTLLNAQVLWENFEDTRKPTYDFNSGTFIPYFTNPDQSGANTSLIAAEYTRNPAELFDVIVMDAGMGDLTDYLSGTKSMSIDVWSPAVGKTVQITLEDTALADAGNFPTGRHSVYLATTTVANAWETLTFSFDNRPDPSVSNTTVNRMVLLFDPNSNNSDTYYWDNLNGPELGTDPCAGVTTDPSILNDFECQQNVSFTFSHSGPNFRRIANPDQTGNTSDFVATYTRNAGEEFDVIVADLGGTLPAPTASTVVQLDVWESLGSTPIRISLQDAAENVIEDLDQTTSNNTSAWNTLTFPVTTTSPDIARMVILFEPGAFVSGLYYFDNLVVTQGSSIEDATAINAVSTYPNPSNGNVTFEYTLDKASDLEISISNVTGEVIDVIERTNQAPGAHVLNWNNESLPEGVYFYNMTTGSQQVSGKIILTK